MSAINRALEKQLVNQLKGALIASCQPVDDGPMDKVEHVRAMALAAIAGGAKGVRIEGVENVKAVAAATELPIVGIIKRDLSGCPIRITPFVDDIKMLADAGAKIIAFDGTDRVRPVDVETLLNTIHECGCIAMADCAEFEEGIKLAKLGCSFIGSTLSGYTQDQAVPEQPDYELVEKWQLQGLKVVAEGRYNSPERAAKAIELGAFCVTVGSAITRIEHITQWFVTRIDGSGRKV
ncbi:N-acetylmannosamine-6-phosphate 2-epimerase [Shewanella nanhaiensis]|uniref:Putative N-acetylmannosamine-6-phosphate 2-epimerase n=1 Tax=Shewanella nanhaiensis TaxID=2864872 RepID=A0ABS7E6R4_9GAMM|nr:N-acetylmannosamine-6-phosphate 2-epimerase [Shewanella nanhaiensis]MBW8185361.1 N-acetylmannosamine-6-phosphate 2-epimerase [Shewanella nanhaiensis]